MNSRAGNKLGFTVLEAVLVLVIVGLIAAVGYKVYSTKNTTDKIANNTTAGSEQTSINGAAVPASINSVSDLEKAEKAIDQYGSSAEDSADLSQLDSELSAF